MYDAGATIDGKSAHEFLLYYMNITYDRIKNIERLDETLGTIVDNNQLNEINRLLFEDVCPKTTYFATREECYKFAHGAAEQGLTALMSNFLINIRTVLEEFENQELTGMKDSNSVFDSEILYESCMAFYFFYGKRGSLKK